MTSVCAIGDCIAGIIANKFVPIKEWDKEVTRFEGKIELWNDLTQYRQIPHIGYVSKGNFCTVCGSALPKSFPELDTVEGDLLPAIGSKVEVHLASSNSWEINTVVGYYVWNRKEGGHRVFIRVRDKDGIPNARLLGSDSLRSLRAQSVV